MQHVENGLDFNELVMRPTLLPLQLRTGVKVAEYFLT